MTAKWIVLGSLACLAAAPTATKAAADLGPSPDCELHIFPVRAVSVNDVTQNSLGGIIPGLINSAFSVRRPEEIAQFMRAAVPRESELRLLRTIDFPTTAKGRVLRTVVHDDPYAGADLAFETYKTSPQISESATSCYHELVLAGFYYEKGTMSKSIKTTYFYREFNNRQQSRKAKFGVESSKATNFPPANEGDVELARTTVVEAYKANLMRILNKP